MAAATLWRAPSRARIGWPEMLAHAVPLLSALGGGTMRALRVAAAIDAHLPTGAFWYLHYAAREPEQQGRGLGSAVIRAGLDLARGASIYLETAKRANVAFYEALGFSITAKWRVGEDGPHFWSMMR